MADDTEGETPANTAEATPTWGEDALAAARACADRLRGHTAPDGLDDCRAALARLRERTRALNPSTLEPRTGLLGVFDSRSKRLKRFREAYREAVRALEDTAGDLRERLAAVEARHGVLETIWADSKAGLESLSGHLATARAWLAERAAPEDRDDPHAAARAHSNELDTEAARSRAAMPLVRVLQNADARAQAAIQSALGGLEDWRRDWTEALGLDRKRPRKVRPDAAALNRATEALDARIADADRTLGVAAARRAEAAGRL